MTPSRLTSLGLAALVAAAGCGKSRGTGADLGAVTLPGGAADGSDVTVEAALCSRCHGDPARAPITGDAAGVAFAPPVDVSGETTGPKVGAHLAHLRAGAFRDEGFLCSYCHVIPQNAGEHTPGVTLRGRASTSLSGTPIAPTYSAGACTSTYCHGDFPGGVGSVTVNWTGAPLTCGTSCHQTPPPNPTHSGYTFPASCPTCHSATVDGTGKIKASGGLHVNGVFDGGCTNCHGTPGRANGGIVGALYDRNQAAAPPAPTTGYASSTVVVGAHAAHSNPVPSVAGISQPTGGVYKPIACTECHPDDTAGGHPNGSLEVTFAGATGADLAGFPASFVQGDGMTTPTTCNTYCHDGKAGGSVATWSWTGAAATCGSCHGFPPASHTGIPADATACNGCHGGTVKADGTIDIAGGLHINGNVEGGESTGGAACGGCHATIFAGMANAAKTSRHALGNVAGTNDSPTDSGISWNAPLSGNAPAARSCVNMCHDDHPHEAGGSADHSYNVYADANQRANTPTTTTRAKTDFSAAATNGGLCVSCHRFASATTAAVDKTAFDASAHDFTARSGATWRYALHLGSFDRNCTKCHASFAEGNTPAAPATASGAAAVHFGDNASLLAGTTSPIAAGNVCLNCHGSAATPANGSQGNRSGKNIQAQFAKANPHDTAGSCLGCHDPHQAKAGTHATPGNLAGPPIHGADGAKLVTNPAFWTTPAAGAFTATPIVAGTDVEATLCFKCHSAAGGTLPAGTTDLAKELNPNNVGNYAGSWASGDTAGGFHPVLATAGANLGAVNLANLQAPWSTSSRNLMTCTDCHESETTTDPNGPHGSTAPFILKGPSTGWASTTITTSTGMPTGTFCSNCHSATMTSSRFSQHFSRSNHRVACWNCHARVPHGGPRPGMLIAPAGAASGVGGTIAGWDTSSPYWGLGTSSSKLYIASYPGGQATAWTQSNCGCNGTGH